MKTNKGSALVVVLVIVGILGFIGFIVFLGISGLTFNTTQGEHTGYVTATQRVGVFWKTYDVYIKTNTQSSQEDKYCVVDDSVFKALQDAQTSKENVTITFGHGHFIPAWQCEGGSVDVITGVK